jgi:hypothetical protein
MLEHLSTLISFHNGKELESHYEVASTIQRDEHSGAWSAKITIVDLRDKKLLDDIPVVGMSRAEMFDEHAKVVRAMYA